MVLTKAVLADKQLMSRRFRGSARAPLGYAQVATVNIPVGSASPNVRALSAPPHARRTAPPTRLCAGGHGKRRATTGRSGQPGGGKLQTGRRAVSLPTKPPQPCASCGAAVRLHAPHPPAPHAHAVARGGDVCPRNARPSHKCETLTEMRQAGSHSGCRRAQASA